MRSLAFDIAVCLAQAAVVTLITIAIATLI